MTKRQWRLSKDGYYATSGSLCMSWSHDKKVFILYNGKKIEACGSKDKCLKAADKFAIHK